MKRKTKLLRALLVTSIALLGGSRASAGQIWDGGGADSNWNTAANWDSNTLPTFTNAITFAGTTRATNVNNLTADTTIGGFNFTNTTAGQAFTISGNRITLGGNTTTTASSGAGITDVVSLAMILNGNRAITTGDLHNLTLSGIISEDVAGRTLTKSGTGTLTLSGNNSYTGTTFINDGITILGNANALGSSASGSGTTINGSNAVSFQGTVLDLGTTGLTLTESFNLNGNGIGRATIRNNSSANQILNGNIDVTSATNSAAITSNSASDAGSITVNGDVSGTLTGSAIFFLRGVSTNASNRVLGNVNITGDLFKADGGTWTIGASSKTYSWTNTTVSGGTLRMGAVGVMPTATVLTLGQSGASTATFNLDGFNQTVAGIVEAAGATTGTRTITSATAATLTVGSASNFSYGGVLTGTSLGLIKTGAGNQTLTATNSYGGGTRIDNGTLTLGHATDTLANTGAVNVNGGTLALGTNSDTVGAVTLTSGSITGTGTATLTGTGSAYDVRSGSVSARLGGSIGLTKTTAGTVTFTGANTYTGTTTLNAGTLNLGVAEIAGTSGPLGNSVAANPGSIVLVGGTLQYSASNTNDYSGRFSTAAGQAYNVDTNGQAVTWATALTSVGGTLNKSGDGTLTLSVANTYSGTTTVNGGTLVVTNPLGLANNGSAKVVIAAPDDSFTGGPANPVLTRAVGTGLNAYAGFGSRVAATSLDPLVAPSPGVGLETTADILISNDNLVSNNLNMSWRSRSVVEAAGSNPNAVLSDVVNITGMDNDGSDIFVLQMSYTAAALSALGLNENSIALSGELRLGYKNGVNPTDWVSATAGNTGANGVNSVGANLNFQGSWADFISANPGLNSGNLNDYLGSRGVDINTKTVWAIIDHNSEFAVIPEPSTLVLGGLALLGFAGVGLRKRRLAKQ